MRAADDIPPDGIPSDASKCRQSASLPWYARYGIIISWLLWGVAVAATVLWTLIDYQPPAEPAWFGMTIHTVVIVIWLYIVREWLELHIVRYLERHISKLTQTERITKRYN